MKRTWIIFLIVMLTACGTLSEPTPPPQPVASNSPIPSTETFTLEPTFTEVPATETPTLAPLGYPVWEGEQGVWKITELSLSTNNVRMEYGADGPAIVFEEDAQEYQILITNEQGVDNIELLPENQFDWPVIVGELDGETVAYEPIYETFLPMYTDYSVIYSATSQAVSWLEKLDKLPDREEFQGSLDWTLAEETGNFDYVGGGTMSSDQPGASFSYYVFDAKVYLYAAGFIRLYSFNGAYADIGRFIYGLPESNMPMALYLWIGGIRTDGLEWSSYLYAVDGALAETEDFDPREMFPVGSFVLVSTAYIIELEPGGDYESLYMVETWGNFLNSQGALENKDELISSFEAGNLPEVEIERVFLGGGFWVLP